MIFLYFFVRYKHSAAARTTIGLSQTTYPSGDGVEPELDPQEQGVILVPADVGVNLGAEDAAVLYSLGDELARKTNSTRT